MTAVPDLDGLMRRTPRHAPIRPPASNPTAASLGFRMPGEFEPQSSVWLAWPGVTTRVWADTPALLDEFTQLARTIGRYETVRVVVDPAFADECAGRLGPGYEPLVQPVDDIWIRDTGPTFVVGKDGALGGVAWHFNVWGDKFDGYERDAELAAHITRAAGARAFAAGLITEGGALHVDGAGTVVVTDSALLNSNRNPGLTRREAEEHLNAALGTRQVIWLPGGSDGDSITDGHVDGLMTFVKPGVVLCSTTDDTAHPRHREYRESLDCLRRARDARGRTLEVIPVALPRSLPSHSRHFCAAYVNCLIVNDAVVIPEFGDACADAAARRTFEAVFGDRVVASVRIDAVASGGGGIHCITQQQPAATLEDF